MSGKKMECHFSTPSDVKRKSPLVEWARGQGLTVLPHPPLLSNNCSQLTDNRSLMGGRHMATPNDPHGLDNPHLNLRNHALLIQHCTVIASYRFILIDVHIYMMPKTIMCRIARYTIDNNPYCRNKHNQIDGGAFSFSSTPQLITIYTSCTL